VGVSYSTSVTAQGNFLLQGLPPGTYSLVVSPAAPFTDITISDILVATGITTDIGMIILP